MFKFFKVLLLIKLGHVLIIPSLLVARFQRDSPMEIKFFVKLCSCKMGQRDSLSGGNSGVAGPLLLERFECPLLQVVFLGGRGEFR